MNTELSPTHINYIVEWVAEENKPRCIQDVPFPVGNLCTNPEGMGGGTSFVLNMFGLTIARLAIENSSLRDTLAFAHGIAESHWEKFDGAMEDVPSDHRYMRMKCKELLGDDFEKEEEDDE